VLLSNLEIGSVVTQRQPRADVLLAVERDAVRGQDEPRPGIAPALYGSGAQNTSPLLYALPVTAMLPGVDSVGLPLLHLRLLVGVLSGGQRCPCMARRRVGGLLVVAQDPVRLVVFDPASLAEAPQGGPNRTGRDVEPLRDVRRTERLLRVLPEQAQNTVGVRSAAGLVVPFPVLHLLEPVPGNWHGDAYVLACIECIATEVTDQFRERQVAVRTMMAIGG
jgi:hypothetical protein